MSEYILSLDAGTTSVRAIVYDKTLRSVNEARKEFRQYYPKMGYVEHDAEEIYKAILNVIKEATEGYNIVSVGITNQRETVVLWREDGKPVAPAIVWQCRRSTSICSKLKREGLEETFHKKTGLLLDPYFSATKIRHFFDENPSFQKEAENGKIYFGTVDSYLIYRLSAGKTHITDYTNASRTLIYNILEKRFDDELCSILNLPKAMLPSVCPSSSENIAKIRGVPSLKDGTPITGVIGDQQGALAGNMCFEEGQIKNTYGTGCFILCNTANNPVFSDSGLLTTLAASKEGKVCYALEGSVFVAGSVIQWLRDEMKIIEDARESYEAACRSKDDFTTFVVPAFVGLGCPYWDSEVSGSIVGIRRGTNKDDIVKASLASIGLQVYDVFREFEKISPSKIESMRVCGGASANEFLMKFQADILNIKIERAYDKESTALGAAIMSAMGSGILSFDEIKKLVKSEKVFTPSMENTKREEIIYRWHKAVEATRVYKP